MTDVVPTPVEVAPPPHRPVAEMLGPSVLIPAFVLMTTLGYALLVRGVGSDAGSPPSKWKCAFTAVNASTLTGFQQEHKTGDYTDAGQWLVLALTLGGTLFSLVAGGLAVVRIGRLRHSDAAVVVTALALTLFVPLVGGLLLLGPTHDVSAHGYFDACFLAASGFGNSGLFTGTLPSGNGFRVAGVLLPLAVAGGLGVPVLLELVGICLGRGGLSRHGRTTLVWSAGVWIAVTLALAAVDYANARFVGHYYPTDTDPANHTTAAAALVDGGREAVNARSAGFPFVFASHLPKVLTATLTVVMLIGGGAGGTAGGVKVTSLAVVAGGTADLFRRRRVGRPFAVALLWIGSYVAAVGLVTLLLAVFESGIQLDRVAFIAASAVGNVGLSHDPIDLTPPGLTVVALAMELGRIGPVLALWYLVEQVPETDVATA